MKYFLSFLFGAACGAGGCFLWLHKEIEKRLNSAQSPQNAQEEPFTFGDTDTPENSENAKKGPSEGSQGYSSNNNAHSYEAKVNYNKLIDDLSSGSKENTRVPVIPRDEDIEAEAKAIMEDPDRDLSNITRLNDIPDGTFLEIDKEEFRFDKSNEKDHLVYYLEDKIMSSENGTIIPNPYHLVGNEWENLIGKYSPNTAYVRNPRLATDYEILVEAGSYVDEWGNDALESED